jgi:1,4-alpha-glucan branching enzyme
MKGLPFKLRVFIFLLSLGASFRCVRAGPTHVSDRVAEPLAASLEGATCSSDLPAFFKHALPSLGFYENTRVRYLKAAAKLSDFEAQVGIRVTKRDARGQATEATLRVLVDNPHSKVYVIGDWNDWGKKLSEADRLKPVPNSPYAEVTLRNPKHGMPYRLWVDGKQVLDPAAAAYTTPEYLEKTTGQHGEALNSVFWDFDRPGAYHLKAPRPDLRGKPLVIGESEVYELVRHWKGGPKSRADTYRFVAESGVIPELKKMGYNAIEFLPFNASLDGANWQHRYLVHGLFAPDSRHGTPEEFKEMVDAFNREDMAVVMDAVLGHYPYQGNKGVRDIGPVGPQNFLKSDGRPVFGGRATMWNTNYYDYENPYVRRYLIDSVLTMIKEYGISGVRFDYLEGIRQSPGGTRFLRELAEEVRKYAPQNIHIAEMFVGENVVMKTLDDPQGLGINFRTDSDYFDWIKDNLQRKSEDIDMGKLRDVIRNEWAWTESARVRYITNHDEAANPRDGATGQYVASLLGGFSSGDHGPRKARAFAALSELSGPAYMDMPQLHLLQQGNFSYDSGVRWDLLHDPVVKQNYEFMNALSRYARENEAFAFQNMHANIENHTDFKNKIISLLRIDQKTGKQVYVLINLSHESQQGYRFGVDAGRPLKLVLDSDNTAYGGSGHLEKDLSSGQIPVLSEALHGKSASVVVPYVPPYGVMIFER